MGRHSKSDKPTVTGQQFDAQVQHSKAQSKKQSADDRIDALKQVNSDHKRGGK